MAQFLCCPSRLYDSVCLAMTIPPSSSSSSLGGKKKKTIHLKSTPGPFFRMKIVFHLQQITPPSPHSLATGPSFRDQPMEVKSAPTRYMRRESVNHFLYVRCLGKSNFFFFFSISLQAEVMLFFLNIAAAHNTLSGGSKVGQIFNSNSATALIFPYSHADTFKGNVFYRLLLTYFSRTRKGHSFNKRIKNPQRYI